MSIYIKNDDNSFRIANDLDLLNRGYESTQRLPPIPSQDYLVSVFVASNGGWCRDHSKIVAIKVIRTVLCRYYETQNGEFTTAPVQQKGIGKGKIPPFGLVHIKNLVEQQSIGNKIARLTISMACFQEIVKGLGDKNIDITFTIDHFDENNLSRLQDHRMKLLKEIAKVDDLIAWQLYG